MWAVQVLARVVGGGGAGAWRALRGGSGGCGGVGGMCKACAAVSTRCTAGVWITIITHHNSVACPGHSQADEDVSDLLSPSTAPGSAVPSGGEASGSTAGGASSPEEAASSSFFRYWDNPAVHLSYLRDDALMSAWRQALTRNAGLLQDKVVLDLGCGPGHLATLCAQVRGQEGSGVEA